MRITPNIVRNAGIWLDTKQVARLCNRTVRWVQLNRGRFTYRRKNVRVMEIELTSALKVSAEINDDG